MAAQRVEVIAVAGAQAKVTRRHREVVHRAPQLKDQTRLPYERILVPRLDKKAFVEVPAQRQGNEAVRCEKALRLDKNRMP